MSVERQTIRFTNTQTPVSTWGLTGAVASDGSSLIIDKVNCPMRELCMAVYGKRWSRTNPDVSGHLDWFTLRIGQIKCQYLIIFRKIG